MKFKITIGIFVVGTLVALVTWRFSSGPMKTPPIGNPVGQKTEVPDLKPEKPAVSQPSAPSTASTAPDLSQPIRQIADTMANRSERISAIRNLGPDLNPHDVNGLYAFLRESNPEDNTPNGQALKNAVMDQLCEFNTPKLSEELTGIYRNKNQNVVLRDYALQHLIEYYQRAAESDEGETSKREWELFAGLLWQAAKETDSTIAGTALLGLSRLSDTQPEFNRGDIVALSRQILSGTAGGEAARITALQVYARMGESDALPAILEIAQHGETLPLRISAIGALGMIGDVNARPFLTDIVGSNLDYLKPAANQALYHIAQLEKQKAKALEDELEKQKFEQLQQQKIRSSTRTL